MSKFANQFRHVDNAARVQELLQIEAALSEHPFPPQIVIENTSYCTLRCIHCSHREMKRPQRHMDRDLWEKIVQEIGKESPNCEVWPTFYGEALILGDDLWKRLDFAAQAGCQNLVLNSNGTLLNKNGNIEKILRSPLRRFILSLDGFQKETFEKIRVKAKWDKVYASVEELCKKREKSGRDYPVIVAQFSVMEENQGEIEDFREYWKKAGAEVKIRPLMEWGAVGSVRSASISHDPGFRIACPWANNTMAIHQNGDVVACAVDYEGKLKVGNARTESLKSLWSRLGEILRKPQREHQWDKLPEICKGCGDWQVAGAEYYGIGSTADLKQTRPFWY